MLVDLVEKDHLNKQARQALKETRNKIENRKLLMLVQQKESREQRIKNAMKREKDRDPNIGGLTNEELNQIQNLADRPGGKNPYNVSTEGGITTLGEETTRRQTPTLAESVE